LKIKVKVGKRGHRFRKFNELSWDEQLLVSEAYFLHLTTGLILKIIPFKWIPVLFSSRQFEAPTLEETQSRPYRMSGWKSKDIELIRTAIQRAGRVSPWKNRCLVSSLAGRCMLRQRKISSQISLGVTKGQNSHMIAHAWLKAGDFEIVEKGLKFNELYQF
jgi:hypothetical protein